MELRDLRFMDGYIGSLGYSWRTPTAADLDTAIIGAMQIENKNRDEIVALIEAGSPVRWCKSPNYERDHSYGTIGRIPSAPAARMVRCDCGHTIPQSQRMFASHGTSCPDCYDRMS